MAMVEGLLKEYFELATPNLRTLLMGRFMTNVVADYVAEMLASFKKLENLIVMNSELDEDGLRKILENGQTLKELKVLNCL